MSAAMNDWITRHRITVDEYHRMFEVGILPPDARVELIEGEIIDMAPTGIDHGSIVLQLNHRLVRAAGDALLVIEVSDSNLRYDLKVKAPLYANHGIPEYWIIDANGRQLRFFRAPKSGQYSDVGSTALSGLHVPVALPDVQIDLADLLDE